MRSVAASHVTLAYAQWGRVQMADAEAEAAPRPEMQRLVAALRARLWQLQTELREQEVSEASSRAYCRGFCQVGAGQGRAAAQAAGQVAGPGPGWAPRAVLAAVRAQRCWWRETSVPGTLLNPPAPPCAITERGRARRARGGPHGRPGAGAGAPREPLTFGH